MTVYFNQFNLFSKGIPVNNILAVILPKTDPCCPIFTIRILFFDILLFTFSLTFSER